MKYNLNLLYRSRPKDQTMNYTIHIHAYDKHHLSYYASWILPVKFLFLPVNRIAAHLIIPSHGNQIIDKCCLECGDHGHCNAFINSRKAFCRCHSGWSGQQNVKFKTRIVIVHQVHYVLMLSTNRRSVYVQSQNMVLDVFFIQYNCMYL